MDKLTDLTIEELRAYCHIYEEYMLTQLDGCESQGDLCIPITQWRNQNELKLRELFNKTLQEFKQECALSEALLKALASIVGHFFIVAGRGKLIVPYKVTTKNFHCKVYIKEVNRNDA